MTHYKPGEILFFIDEETTIIVVMANDEGVRYYDPCNPQLDENGNIKTYYASNAYLYDNTTTLGTIYLVAKRLAGVLV